MKTSIKTVFLFLIPLVIQAQDNIVSFDFKKGEVLDIILLSTVKDSEKLFDRYKKTAFPVAFEYTYRPQPGFNIGKLTLGTNLPSTFIFGKWKSKEKRVGFLENIAKKVPDFHQQRRTLFPYFGLTYYEMPKDLKFSVDIKKYNVATSFWQKDTKSFSNFSTKWKKEIAKAGGTFVLQLQDGTSPIGYNYDPELFCIVQWENETAFEEFAKHHPLSNYEVLKNVHQFVID